MKKLIFAVLMLTTFVIASCGGYSESDYTDDAIKIACEMMHKCDEAEGFQVGDNEKECVQAMKALAGMGDEEDDECKFNSSKAEDCIDCQKKLSCADYYAEEEKCPVCEEICG
jgi:hypothetical protein